MTKGGLTPNDAQKFTSLNHNLRYTLKALLFENVALKQ